MITKGFAVRKGIRKFDTMILKGEVTFLPFWNSR
jgi:hypothetical protein